MFGGHRPDAEVYGELPLHNGSPFKTDCRHSAIGNARSIPDIHISSLTVSNGASISMTVAAAPDQKRPCTASSFISATRTSSTLKKIETL
jgi:hypothetical protein